MCSVNIEHFIRKCILVQLPVWRKIIELNERYSFPIHQLHIVLRKQTQSRVLLCFMCDRFIRSNALPISTEIRRFSSTISEAICLAFINVELMLLWGRWHFWWQCTIWAIALLTSQLEWFDKNFWSLKINLNGGKSPFRLITIFLELTWISQVEQLMSDPRLRYNSVEICN